MSDTQYRLDTGKPQRPVEQTHRLLNAVTEIQLQFSHESESPTWLEEALRIFLEVTNSLGGFIGEFQHNTSSTPEPQTTTISNPGEDKSLRHSCRILSQHRLTEQDSLLFLRETLRSGEQWFSNESQQTVTDDGCLEVFNLMTVPLKLGDRFIGVVGVVNRRDGYNSALADWLEPLSTTCATLLVMAKTRQAHKIAEANAVDQQEQLQTVLNTVNARILYLDADGDIIRSYLPSQRLTNLSHDNNLNSHTSIFDYYAAEAHETIRHTLHRVFGTGESDSYEAAGRGSPAERRIYMCRVVLDSNSTEPPVAMLLATDVTEERTAREAEARHFTLLQAVTEGTTELIFAKDLESRPVFVNNAVTQLYGKTLEQMIEHSEVGVFSDSVQKQFIDHDRRIIQTGNPDTIEQTLPFPSGDRTFLTTKCPWKNSAGETIGVIGVSRDITEWKATKNALHDSREHLKAIIDSTPECVKLLAQDGTLLEMNPAGLQIIEADSAESVIGRNVFGLITPECREAFLKFHHQVCSGIPGSIQYEIIGLKGTRRWMETHAAPLCTGPDEETVHLAITRDITAAREAEVTIAEKQAQLIHVSRLSSMGQMAAVISHEVTQPLAAISNFATTCTLISQQPLPDLHKLTGYLNAITEQSVRAGAILSRVRGFVRRSDEYRIFCNLIQLVEDSLALVQSHLRIHHVSMKTSFPDEVVGVFVDSVQIQQVIVNLVSNACDAMASQPLRERFIEISVSYNEKQATVEVCDNGPGLDDELRTRVFTPFFTTKTDGLGMGLSICSDIIDSHSGSLTVENTENRGALFCFSLPRSENTPDE